MPDSTRSIESKSQPAGISRIVPGRPLDFLGGIGVRGTRAGSDHPAVARWLADRVLSIPMHHKLSDEQVREIAEAVAKVAAAFA